MEELDTHSVIDEISESLFHSGNLSTELNNLFSLGSDMVESTLKASLAISNSLGSLISQAEDTLEFLIHRKASKESIISMSSIILLAKDIEKHNNIISKAPACSVEGML